MTDIKLGDRVIVTRYNVSGLGHPTPGDPQVGDVGTVEGVKLNLSYPYDVFLDHVQDAFLFTADELRVIDG